MHIDGQVKKHFYKHQPQLEKKNWPTVNRSRKVSRLYDKRLSEVKPIQFDTRLCSECGGTGLIENNNQKQKITYTVCTACKGIA